MPIVKQHLNETIEHDERKTVRDRASLERQLSDPSPSARRWAARDLAGCPGSTAALVDRLQCEQESSVREMILTTLIQRGGAQAVDCLMNFLHSEAVALRNEAVEAMKLLPGEVSRIMDKLLKDPDPDVRIYAVNILESLRHEQVEEWLKEVIEQDPHVNVCATAVDLLGEVGTLLSMEALEKLEARFPDEPYIRFAADLALKRIYFN